MRIISGTLKGRTLEAPKGHKTHPMSEKARGGLFNVLGDVSGLSVLDAFSGSGAIACEAVSRGANDVVAIEKDKSAHNVITRNIENLGIKNQVKATRANIASWLDNNPDVEFDIVVCDPPYDKVKPGLIHKVFERIRMGGIGVLSIPSGMDFHAQEELTLLQKKDYGDATLVFYKKTG